MSMLFELFSGSAVGMQHLFGERLFVVKQHVVGHVKSPSDISRTAVRQTGV
ncbi:MAG TPA: hypothetical protein VK853_00600 [Ilumatobacteraceae bacterium]|nr:hypothetical protein [Ilumatobacteraceae bacterium]